MTAIGDDGIIVEPYRVAPSELRLMRSRMLAGKLIDSDGQPVPGCKVFGDSAAMLVVQTTAVDGSFKLALPPGRAYVSAYEPIDPSDAKPLAYRAFGSAALEIPGTGIVDPIMLKLAPQGEGNSDEWLKRSTPGTHIVRHTDAMDVTGVVVDDVGKPVAGAKVFDADGPIVVTNDQGEFRVGCDQKAPVVMHAFLPGFHVWFGRPTAGDVLKIVLEKKPPTEEAQAAVKMPEVGADRAASAIMPRPILFDAWPVFRGDAAGTGVAHTTLPETPSLLWKSTFDGGGFTATAAILDGVVYIGGVDGKLSALNLANGETKWQFHAPAALHAAPAVAGGMVYIGDADGELHAVDAADGTEKWSIKTGGEINAGATFYAHRLLFTSQDGGLYCVDTADGAIEWKYTAGDWV